MRVKTKQQISDFSNFPGVYQLILEDGYMIFDIDPKKLGEIMTHLSSHEILDLQSTPPALEDLFMGHYQEEGGSNHV